VWESGGIAPRILNLGCRWRLEVSFMLRPLYRGGEKKTSTHYNAIWTYYGTHCELAHFIRLQCSFIADESSYLQI